MINFGLIVIMLLLGTIRDSIADGQPCSSNECLQVAEEIKIFINSTADPCNDFSEYACGNMGKKFHIPAGYNSYSIFTEMGDNIDLKIKQLLTNNSIKQNTVQYKPIKLINSCMDMNKRNKFSKSSMKKLLTKIGTQKTFEDKLLKLITTGVTSRWFRFMVGPDSKNPKYSILSIEPPSLIMSREILAKSNKTDNQKNINAYRNLMNFTTEHFKLGQKEMLEKIIELNIEIAKLVPEIYELMDPVKTYNKFTVKQLTEQCSEINWLKLINGQLKKEKFTNEDKVLVFSKSFLGNVCKLLKKYKSNSQLSKVLDLDVQLAPIVPLLRFGSQIMSDKYDEYSSALYGISGKKSQMATCIEQTSGSLQLILSNMFVKEYFNTTARADILGLIENMKQTFHDMVKNEKWMDNSTKEMALLKLKTMISKIGFSDRHLNQTFLENYYKNLNMKGLDYLQHIIDISTFDFKQNRKKIGIKIPDDQWEMSTFEINAYFNPIRNEIVFPAAILSKPLYSSQYIDILKYPAIGAVISHEILHSFDTSGSQYDHEGMLKNWWTNETRKQYNVKNQCIIDQYGNYEYLGEKLPSKQTIGEDIADNTGILIAYTTAFSRMQNPESSRIEGLDYTPEQLFFLKYARNWCTLVKPEALKLQMRSDVHSIWKYRINGPLSNMPEFSKAFKCGANTNMNRQKKCTVW